MASLTKKIIQGKPYYYLRECQRVGGRPKIVKTKYLGSLASLLARLSQADTPAQPQAVDIADFGEIAALWDLAQQLDLVGVIDQHVPKRQQGLSVGQYLVLAAINRAAHPTSKTGLADWYRQTILTRLLPASAVQLSCQAFWNHMDLVEATHIEAIEKDLSQRLVERFQISLRTLVYDGTNFFTYLATSNPAQLPARGHNKQKRTDLRQVNLGMLVSTDFHVPLFHKVYTGNINDATEFKTITEDLRLRYQQLAAHCQDITLIFDKGNNSQEAFDTLLGSGFHFVGSLVASQHPELLEVPRRRFHPLAGERLQDCLAYRTELEVFGAKRTVVTYNENLLAGQLQGIQANLQKSRAKLHALQHRLKDRRQGRTRGGKAPTVESVRHQVDQILSAQFMKRLMEVEVTPAQVPGLSFRTNTQALGELLRRELGKTILFTDNQDWTDEQIILGYRAQSHVEDAFREMKNPHFLGWSPMFHWTDSKIKVHAFYCVLALMLASLLQRSLHQKGLDLSIRAMLESLAAIKQTTVIFEPVSGSRKPRLAACLSKINDQQRRLFDALDLRRFAPA